MTSIAGIQKYFGRVHGEEISRRRFSLFRRASDAYYGPSTQKQRKAQQIIQDFNRSIALIADTDALIRSIAARINELFGADRVILLHTYPDSGVFSVAFCLGYEAAALKVVRLAQGDRLAKWLFTNERALILDRDLGVLSYLSAAERDMLEKLDVRVCAPMLALNRLTGLMLLSSTRAEWSLNDEDLKILFALLSQSSIAYESAYLSQLQRDRMRRLYWAERLATAGQLAASIAHEIRNPLTSIRSTVQYLLNDFDQDNPKRELIKGVISEVDRIDRTVDGLMNLTRRTSFTPQKLSLGPLISQSLLLIRIQAQEQKINIEWEEAHDVVILADDAQLRQLLLNLMMNALQAMGPGESLQVDLSVEPQHLESPGSKKYATLSIADTGCGIPPENLDKIFDPFFTTKPGGTGLGLPTCYAIVRQHGGEFDIDSREKKGTTIRIRLPLAE
jgi:signal transduction histidine kinase